MALSNESEELALPPALQKRIDTARANLTLSEQENIRLIALNRDQESILRGVLEKNEQVTAELEANTVLKATLDQEVKELSDAKSEVVSDMMALKRSVISLKEEKAALTEEVAALNAEHVRVTAEIAKERADFEKKAANTSAQLAERDAEVKKGEAELAGRKDKLVKFLETL